MSEGNGFATRDALLKPMVRRFSAIEIPDVGKFRIRSLTELERSRFEQSTRDKKGQPSTAKMLDIKCRLIVLCVVDGEGNQLFTNSDIEVLRNQDAKHTNTLVEAIMSHCGFSDVDMEEIEKNSGATATAN